MIVTLFDLKTKMVPFELHCFTQFQEIVTLFTHQT